MKRFGKYKTLVKLGIGIVAIGVVCLAIYLIRVQNYQNAVSNLTIKEVSLSTIADGTYEGSCNVDFVMAKVSVTVKDHKIVNVNLVEHKTERGQAAECIVDNMVEQQKVDVDIVSGATNSSKVIKKAVENALTNQD